ncbi:MAG: amidohydrolase family protein [Gammaproteobacteria bacterium]
MRSIRQFLTVSASCAALLAAGAVARGEGGQVGRRSEVWLHEGAELSVSALPGGDRIVFGLVSRAWTVKPAEGLAAQLTDDHEIAQRPVLSPDGRLFAYETIRGGVRQIMVQPVDGGAPRQVTFGSFHHRSPAWSPPNAALGGNGNRLIMSSNRGGRYGIWEVDVDTLRLRQLTFASHDAREPAWNEDGTRIAYVTDTSRGTALYAARPGEDPQLLLEERARIRAPAWRPGGGLLTYVRQRRGDHQLRMLILSQPAITKPITHGEYVFPYPAQWLDRSRFLYTADGRIRRRRFGGRHAEPIDFRARLEIAAASWSQRPAQFGSSGNFPVAGSNGRSVGADGRLIIAALGDLWEFGSDGALARQLTNDAYVDASPALEPDGTRLAFVSDRGGSLQIWLLNLDTLRRRRLTRERGVALEPRWAQDGTAIEYRFAAHPAAAAFLRRRVDLATGVTETLDESTGPSAHPGNNPTQATGIPLTWRPIVAGGRKIVRAGRIFDGLGPGYLSEHEIVIDGGHITDVRPWSTQTGVQVVDARTQTVIPGLIDMSITQAPLGDERLGRKYLAYGVTTIREAITDPAEALERRESWSSGRRIGPRLLLTGTRCDNAGTVSGRAEVQPANRPIVNEAVDRALVSVGICPSLEPGRRAELIATARAKGLPAVTARAFPDVLLGASETRAPPAGYADFAIVTGKLRTTVTSNLSPSGLPMLVDAGELTTGWQFRTLFTAAERDWYRRGWQSQAANAAEAATGSRALIAALARGARVVAGSDAPRVPPGLGLHAELRLLTRAGLQPFQVLRMATLDAGRALGAGNRLGRIRPGAVADMVVVDGDPLGDVRHAINISLTIAGGRIYTREALGKPGTRPASVGNLYN